MNDGKEKQVQDSRHLGRPAIFQMGQFEVAKCWDLALTNMHAGEKLKMFCPATYANGGAEIYSDFDSFRIPENTDLTYVIEVLECEPTINKINAHMKKYHLDKLKKKTCADKKMQPDLNPASPKESKKEAEKKKLKDESVLKKVKAEVETLKKNVAKQQKKVAENKVKAKKIDKEIKKEEKKDGEAKEGEL